MSSKKRGFIFSVLIVLTATVLYPFTDSSTGTFDEQVWADTTGSLDRRLFYAPHLKDGRFFNPWLTMPAKGFFTMLKWRLIDSRADYSAEENTYLPTVNSLTADYINENDNFITWIGHASLIVKSSGRVFLIDPVFGEVPFIKKRRVPSALSYDEAQKIQGEITVLLTHNHYDHLDSDSIKNLPAHTSFIVPKGLAEEVKDIREASVREMDWWEETDAGGVKVVLLPSQHWSKRGLFDTNRSLWGSFLIDTGKKKIFICGDTGFSTVYSEIATRYPGIDYAFISTGASQPRWFMHYAHQNEREAVTGFKMLGAKKLIPIHWGSFSLGDEPAGYPAFHLKKILPEATIIGGGEIIRL